MEFPPQMRQLVDVDLVCSLNKHALRRLQDENQQEINGLEANLATRHDASASVNVSATSPLWGAYLDLSTRSDSSEYNSSQLCGDPPERSNASANASPLLHAENNWYTQAEEPLSPLFPLQSHENDYLQPLSSGYKSVFDDKPISFKYES